MRQLRTLRDSTAIEDLRRLDREWAARYSRRGKYVALWHFYRRNRRNLWGRMVWRLATGRAPF